MVGDDGGTRSGGIKSGCNNVIGKLTRGMKERKMMCQLRVVTRKLLYSAYYNERTSFRRSPGECRNFDFKSGSGLSSLQGVLGETREEDTQKE